eukprot:RCo040673
MLSTTSAEGQQSLPSLPSCLCHPIPLDSAPVVAERWGPPPALCPAPDLSSSCGLLFRSTVGLPSPPADGFPLSSLPPPLPCTSPGPASSSAEHHQVVLRRFRQSLSQFLKSFQTICAPEAEPRQVVEKVATPDTPSEPASSSSASCQPSQALVAEYHRAFSEA